jgi:hypothetical protein
MPAFLRDFHAMLSATRRSALKRERRGADARRALRGAQVAAATLFIFDDAELLSHYAIFRRLLIDADVCRHADIGFSLIFIIYFSLLPGQDADMLLSRLPLSAIFAAASWLSSCCQKRSQISEPLKDGCR